jgi:hypothetical protein
MQPCKIPSSRPFLLTARSALWTPEMYELHGGAPFRRDKAGKVYDSSGTQLHLMGATAEVLKELATDPKWKGTKVRRREGTQASK